MVQLVPGARQKAEPVYSYGKTANVQVAEQRYQYSRKNTMGVTASTG
jgi:hypothetical protein